eukprot:scpid72801/ scgid12215/ Serine/threonine-protein kinase SBK1; SH3-binding kinase 1
MATGGGARRAEPTAEDRFMDGYFNDVRHHFPNATDFKRARAAYQSSKPQIITAPRIRDVKDERRVLYSAPSRTVMTVRGKDSLNDPDSVLTVMKLHQVHSREEKKHSSALYRELLMHMYVQRREAELRKNKPHRLFAVCEPYWYKFRTCVGFELEYFPSGTLRELVCSVADEDERLGFLRDAARGLHFLNSRLGIVHFDVKPTNICIYIREDCERFAKLIDFGSAVFAGQLVDRRNRRLLGDTIRYRPPELFARPRKWIGEDFCAVCPSADSWRFGLCVLELMTRSKVPVWIEAKYSDPVYVEFVRSNRFCMPGAHKLTDGYPLKFPGRSISNVPECALRLLHGLLRPNAAERMSMEAVIRQIDLHFKSDSEPPVYSEPPVFRKPPVDREPPVYSKSPVYSEPP